MVDATATLHFEYDGELYPVAVVVKDRQVWFHVKHLLAVFNGCVSFVWNRVMGIRSGGRKTYGELVGLTHLTNLVGSSVGEDDLIGVVASISPDAPTARTSRVVTSRVVGGVETTAEAMDAGSVSHDVDVHDGAHSGATRAVLETTSEAVDAGSVSHDVHDGAHSGATRTVRTVRTIGPTVPLARRVSGQDYPIDTVFITAAAFEKVILYIRKQPVSSLLLLWVLERQHFLNGYIISEKVCNEARRTRDSFMDDSYVNPLFLYFLAIYSYRHAGRLHVRVSRTRFIRRSNKQKYDHRLCANTCRLLKRDHWSCKSFDVVACFKCLHPRYVWTMLRHRNKSQLFGVKYKRNSNSDFYALSSTEIREKYRRLLWSRRTAYSFRTEEDCVKTCFIPEDQLPARITALVESTLKLFRPPLPEIPIPTELSVDIRSVLV